MTTFLINHFDLFGLRQVWLYLIGKPYTANEFRTPGPYRLVRHPLYVGWLLVAWAAPVMTAAHLVYAIGSTAYILIAIQFEERDLVRFHREYAEYRRRVPMLLPNALRRRASDVKGWQQAYCVELLLLLRTKSSRCLGALFCEGLLRQKTKNFLHDPVRLVCLKEKLCMCGTVENDQFFGCGALSYCF